MKKPSWIRLSVAPSAKLAMSAGLALTACQGILERDAIAAERGDMKTKLYLDVHRLDPKDVSVEGVAEAHAKDLAVQASHAVRYERYWVDELDGTIYCLAQAHSADAAAEVHREAHGLVADEIHAVVPGILPAAAEGDQPLFLDTHELEPGVRPEDVADAHRADLAVEGKHGVRFLEYWVDPAKGRVYCLAQAPSAKAVIETHREAHGLVPTRVDPVVAGQ